MMSDVVPGRELEVETGGIHHHLVLAFCLLSVLVVVLLSILAYLVINRGQPTNKFNILDNLGKTLLEKEIKVLKLFSSEWTREGREEREGRRWGRRVHHEVPVQDQPGLGQLRPASRHEEPQEHQEGRQEGRRGGHCWPEQCEVNITPVQSSPVSQKNKLKISPNFPCDI